MLNQRCGYTCLILLVFLLTLFFPLGTLVASHLPHSLCNPLILFILGLIPVNVVLTRYLLYLFPISIRLLDQIIPLLDIEAFLLIQLRLAATNGKVERRAVGYLSVMVEKPEITTDEGGKTDKVLVRNLEYYMLNP